MAKKQSLEQFVAGELDLDLRQIPLDRIDMDPDNPNVITPRIYEHLKATIRDYGFWQPVLVTPVGDRYRMIDGEHRARIISELGGAKIPAVVADEMSVPEARLMLLNMNGSRGDFEPLKFANFVDGLTLNYSEAELRARIGMDETQLRATLDLAHFTDDPGDLLRDQIEQERIDAPTTLRFVVNNKDAEIVERVITAAAGATMDRGQALTQVCVEYEKAHPKAKTKEPAE